MGIFRTPVTLTVVIPTKGRKTIDKALESLKPEHHQGIKVNIEVVYDTHGDRPSNYYSFEELYMLCKRYGAHYSQWSDHYNDWGYPQLNFIYKRQYAQNSLFIINIGDDDVMIPDAISKMTDIIQENGIMPYLFQAVLHPSAHRGNTEPITLWNDEDRSIERKKVTGQNLVIPYIPHMMGEMVDDFVFIKTTIERWHGVVKWIPVPIVECF